MPQSLVLELNAVIVAVTRGTPRILLVSRPVPAAVGEVLDALPSGPLDPSLDRTLELGLRRWVREQTGIELGYVEQLYTFGDLHRDPRERKGGPRLISIPYLALVRETPLPRIREAAWRDWYRYFPWELWLPGRPAVIDEQIAPVLSRWSGAGSDPVERKTRRERVEIAFGLGGASWDEERVLERYELLYEAGLVAESTEAGKDAAKLGRPMALDHRRILATALGRLRGKIKYRPVVFELLPPTFTLFQLQQVVEALAGILLHKQNFRRLVEKGGLVETTGRYESRTGGRPAKLFRFRREVLRERLAPGVGLPGASGSAREN